MMDHKTLHARGVSCNLVGIILSDLTDRTPVHLEELNLSTAEDTEDTQMMLVSSVFISALMSNETDIRALITLILRLQIC